MNHATLELQRPVAGVDHVALARPSAGEQPSGDEWLERRSRLEGLGERRGGRRVYVLATARHGENVALMRIQHDDVPAVRAHLLHRLTERVLGDLLQLVIEREHDSVPRPRGDAWRVRRLEAAAADVADECRRTRGAAQNAVERQLDTVDGVVLRIDAADEPPRAFGHRIGAHARRARVYAANACRRGDVSREVAARKREPCPAGVEGATYPLGPELHPHQRPTQCRSILRSDFSWRDLELHHLATLGEHESRRVENVAAWRRRLARRELLARRPCPPCVALKQLHVSSLSDDRKGKHREQPVHDLDATGTDHGCCL